LTLLCGIVGSSDLLASLAVLLGEARGALQRIGQLHQDPRGPLRGVPRISPLEFSGAGFAVASIVIDQLGPSTL
jgi:hypothetical protein